MSVHAPEADDSVVTVVYAWPPWERQIDLEIFLGHIEGSLRHVKGERMCVLTQHLSSGTPQRRAV